MSWWERVMLRLFPHHHPQHDPSAQVEVAFARLDASRVQMAVAADETSEAAAKHSEMVLQERLRIKARTAETAAKWPSGRTSAMRDQVNALVERQQRRDRDT